MIAHTPGPWKVEKDNGEWRLVGAHANTVLLIGDDRRLIPTNDDAQAISAVPELIRALQMIVRGYELSRVAGLETDIDAARAALEKAGAL